MELFPRFTQDTRLLRITTPLGQNTLLAEFFKGEEGLSRGYSYKVSVLATDAHIRLRSLLGQPVLLELLTAGSSTPFRPFHGHITAAELTGANGGFARYTLRIEPWSSFMALGRDSRIFQDKTVFDILDAIFRGWQDLGRLVPSWRYEIADRSIYPPRSLTCQYQESNLGFAERLMCEEGLFYYFEHSAAPDSPDLGSHTLVIADHNGSFKPNAQATVRFTQPGAVMREDSVDRWRILSRAVVQGTAISSWDYRSNRTRPVEVGMGEPGCLPLSTRDTPGPYAYPTRSHGERIADNQLQALQVDREVHSGAGTVRTFSPSTTFSLSGQAQLDRAPDEDGRTFVLLRVRHFAHNNLSADLGSAVTQALGPSPLAAALDGEGRSKAHGSAQGNGERPLYRNGFDAIRSNVPYRSSGKDQHGVVLHPKPTVHGQQTAIVVGPAGATIHTDRDHRIKVQFHWQRAAGNSDLSHSRLNHPAPEGQTGAPANDCSGTWVRVATPLAPVAGGNWGSVAVPRVGSEVLIDFLEGNIDRPVVIGSLYNGRGRPDAQHNEASYGAGVATGNAPAWFPGDSGAHAHPAALSGIKTQSMGTSQDGGGAYNQLVFDDSPGQSRTALQSHAKPHAGTAELNLGHLRHQTDNQRLHPAGFGAELKADHSTAVRSGQGLLLSSDVRQGASGHQLDSGEAQAQNEASHSLQVALARTAQQHNATLKDEQGQSSAPPEKLPAIGAIEQSIESIKGLASEGGQRQVTAYRDPQLQLSSPAGIVASTPADVVLTAGKTSSISAAQDINFASQANSFHAVRAGISFFTYGKAGAKEKPNQETGIRFHAASGKVSSDSQSDATRLTADKTITVASVTKSVTAAARKHVLLTAQGAYLKLEGGDIMLHAPGRVDFKASTKEIAGPASAAAKPKTVPVSKLTECPSALAEAGAGGASAI
jgi:type VI secretion system VgrG family protein